MTTMGTRDLDIFTSKTIWERHRVRFIFPPLLKMGDRARTTAGSDERRRRKVLEASLCRGLSQKAPNHVSCYYYAGKCYFNAVPQKGILWVGCILE
jgi:hypothetical protein